MKFNTKDLNPGVWFYFDEDHPEKGGVCLRRMSSKKLRAIQKNTQTVKVEYRKGRRFESVKTNDDMESMLMWDYCIADWKAVEDEDGTPIEPTKENKSLLMGGSPGFAGFVADALETLDVDLIERKEEAPGN